MVVVSSNSVFDDGISKRFIEFSSSVVTFGFSFFVLFKGGFKIGDVADPKVNVGGEDDVFVFNLIFVFNEGLDGVEFSRLEGSRFSLQLVNEFIDVLEEFSNEVIEVSGINGETVNREGTLVVIDVSRSDFFVRSTVKVVVKVVVTSVLLEGRDHVMLGDQRKHVSSTTGHVVLEFHESTIVSVKVSSEAGVGNGGSEESEESGGVLVGLKLLDEEEVGGTSGLESSTEGIEVRLDLVLSFRDFFLVSGDLVFDIKAGSGDIGAVLVLLSREILEVGDVLKKGSFSECPVVNKVLDVGSIGSVKSNQELNDGVNLITSLDELLQVEVNLTLRGQSEESEG